MKEYKIIGQHAWYLFKSNTDGSVLREKCTLEEYDALALPNPQNPQKTGYTFVGASKGYMVDSSDGFLEPESYWVEGEKVIYRDDEGKYGKLSKVEFDDKLRKKEKIKSNF